MPKLRLKLDRWRKATSGVVVVIIAAALVPLAAGAATISTYSDQFANESFSGSDGPDSWSTAWSEVGEADGPGDGAIEVPSDGHCHTDICLRLGMNGPPSASVTRAFDASGGDAVTLTFDYKRHVHGSGNGSVVLSASTDGATFTPVATYQLSLDDGSQQAAVHDLSSVAGGLAWIRFELVGADDDTHMNIDNLVVIVIATNNPTFDQDLGDRTDSENDTVSIASGASHPTGDTLLYSAANLPPGISIDPDTGQLDGTIDYTASGSSPYSTEIIVTDSDGDSDTDTFNWTVLDLNRIPTATSWTEDVPEDDPGHLIDLVDTATASDPDGDTLTLTGLDLSGVVVGDVTDNGDGTVTYVPGPDFDGAESLGYTVSDGKGGSSSSTVTLDVIGAPDPPTISALSDISVAEGTVISFTAAASDPDAGASLLFSLVAGPDPVPVGAAIEASTGDFSWLTDEADGPGTYEFAVKVTDDTARSAQTPLKIVVAEANEAPILADVGPLFSAEGDTIAKTLSVTDEDLPKGVLTFSAIGLPPGLALNSSSGLISGSLSYESAGFYTATVTVVDDGSPAKTDSISISWTVSPTNREPIIESTLSDLTVDEQEEISVAVKAKDPDGDSVVFTAIGLPAGVSIDPTNGDITGAPALGTGGRTYDVVVKARDVNGGVASVAFRINVAVRATSTTTPEQTVTTAPTTTTTSTPTTTSTTPQVAVTIPDEEEPPAGSTPALTLAQAVQAKQGLVVASSSWTDIDGEASSSAEARFEIGPREGLTVTFRSAVETLQSHLLSSIALGVAVSFLLLIGVDRDERRRGRGGLAST